MSKEIYEDVLKEEPMIVDSKERKKWKKRLATSIGWIDREVRGEFLYVLRKDGVTRLRSPPLGKNTYHDVSTGEGSFCCKDEEHAKILSLVLQINERLRRIEKK